MLEAFITYSVFFIEVAIINYWDYRKHRTIFNPVFCLSIPFSVILIFCLLFNTSLGFVSFHYEALWIWIIGLFLFWLPGVLIFSKKQIFIPSHYDKLSNKFLVSFIICCCLLYMLTQLNSVADYDVGSKEMGEEIAVGGIKGRVSNILLVACPFVVCMQYNRLLKFSAILILIYFLFATGSKTWILYAFVVSIFCLYKQHKLSINLLSILFTCVGGILIFGLYYFLNTDIYDFQELVEFVSRHFYFYLTSGILPMGEYVHYGSNITSEGFVLPFINIVNIWLGNSSAAAHSAIWYTTDNVLGTQSNVFTFFGTLYIGDNILALCFYSFLFGLLSYELFFLYKLKGHLFFLIMNGYNLCVLLFGWYNCAFGLLRIWEIILITLLFYALTMCRISFVRTR